jgi:hypothetical protein
VVTGVSPFPGIAAIIVRKRMPNSVSITVGKKTTYAEEHRDVAAEQVHYLSRSHVERA